MSPKIRILIPTCLIFLHVAVIAKHVCSPQFWVQTFSLFFLSSRKIFLKSVLLPTFSTTKYLCYYTCQNLHSLGCILLSVFTFHLFIVPVCSWNLPLNATQKHFTNPARQKRAEQIFAQWVHMPLREKVIVGNDFCKTWCFRKPVRGEEPECPMHSDFVLREKGFNITVWDSTVSSKGSRSHKNTVTAVRKPSLLLSRMLCRPVLN